MTAPEQPGATPGAADSAPTPARRAVIALGGNLGDRDATIRGAVDALRAAPGVEVVAVSPLHETVALRPEGYDPDAPRYLNAVVLVRTAREPRALLELARRIERDFGRERVATWGDRTLDVDLITVDGVESRDPELTLPHPRAASRRFVLQPWSEIDPDAVLPGHGRVADLLAALPHDDGAGS